jgi:hypothetical protein
MSFTNDRCKKCTFALSKTKSTLAEDIFIGKSQINYVEPYDLKTKCRLRESVRTISVAPTV